MYDTCFQRGELLINLVLAYNLMQFIYNLHMLLRTRFFFSWFIPFQWAAAVRLL